MFAEYGRTRKKAEAARSKYRPDRFNSFTARIPIKPEWPIDKSPVNFTGTKFLPAHLLDEAVTRRSTRRRRG
jgi:hypothetical protein